MMLKRLLILLTATACLASSASAQFLMPGARGRINPSIPQIGGCVNSPSLALVTGQANYVQCDAFSNAKIVNMDAAGNARGANVTAAHELLVTGSGTAGTAATNVLTVQGIASMTPLLVTPAANSAVNVAQINGVTPLMGNGVTGTGSLRVTIASDNTTNSNPFLVTGSGTAGSAASGVITVQGIASMTKLLVTPDANSAVNVAQINGVTPLMGNGVTGTGSLRVTIASDTTSNSNAFLVTGCAKASDGISARTNAV